VFESYNAQSRLLKYESVVVLTGKEPIVWPTLELRTPVTDLDKAKEVPVEYEIANNTVFSLGSELRYVFAPHKGWEPGETHQQTIDPQAETAECLGHVPAARRLFCAGALCRGRYPLRQVHQDHLRAEVSFPRDLGRPDPHQVSRAIRRRDSRSPSDGQQIVRMCELSPRTGFSA